MSFFHTLRRLFYPLYWILFTFLFLSGGFLFYIHHQPLSLKLFKPYISKWTGLSPFDLSLGWSYEKGFDFHIDGLTFPTMHLSFKKAHILWNPFGEKSFKAQGVALILQKNQEKKELNVKELAPLFSMPIDLKNVQILTSEGQTIVKNLDLTLQDGVLLLSIDKKNIGHFKLNLQSDFLKVDGIFQNFPIPLPLWFKDVSAGLFKGKMAYTTKGDFVLDVAQENSLKVNGLGVPVHLESLHVEGKDFQNWTSQAFFQLGSLGLQIHANGTEKDITFNVKTDKTLDKKGLVDIWPEQFVPQGRSWVAQHIQKAMLKDVTLSGKKALDKPLELQGHFLFHDMDIALDSPVGHITHLAGHADLTENSLQFHCIDGQISQQKIHNAIITLAPFEGETFFKGVFTLKGALEPFLRYLSQLGGEKKLSLKNIKGNVSSEVKVDFPLSADLKTSQINIDLKSQGEGAQWRFPLGDKTLLMKTPKLSFTKKPVGFLELKGVGSIDGHASQWTWASNDTLSFQTKMPVCAISTFINGPDITSYFKGTAVLKGKITPRSRLILFDLSQVEGDFPLFKWTKKKGVPLGADLKIDGDTYRLKVHGALKGEGQLNLKKQQAQGQLTFQDTMLMGHFKNNAYRLFIDANEIVLPPPSKVTKPKTPSVHRPSFEIGKTISIQGQIQRVVCAPIIFKELSFDVKASIKKDCSLMDWKEWMWGESQVFSEIQSETPRKKRKTRNYISLDIQPRQEDKRFCTVQGIVSHGGMLLEAFGVHDPSPKGACYIFMKQERDGYHGDVSLKKVKTRSSSIAKIISLASPTLFTEFFSSGLVFQVKSHFVYKDGQLFLENLLAESLNLGLALQGNVNCNLWTADLKGVVIPSYFLNTFLGHFPLIGWIFGGNKGVLSSEIILKGPLKDLKVSVNPLTLFKFGFIKDIVEGFNPQPKAIASLSPPSHNEKRANPAVFKGNQKTSLPVLKASSQPHSVKQTSKPSLKTQNVSRSYRAI